MPTPATERKRRNGTSRFWRGWNICFKTLVKPFRNVPLQRRGVLRPNGRASGSKNLSSAPENVLPRSFAALEALIARRHGGLSSRLRDIAEFALAHPDAVALETVAGVAALAGVAPSALVRFAQALGFEGFSDMQRVFRERFAPPYRERIRPNEPGSAPQVLERFVQGGIEALERLGREIPPESLDAAAGLIADARRVGVVARRRSFPVATYLAYGLLQLGKPALLLDGAGGFPELEAATLGEGDLLIAVSFKPYAPETLHLAARARETGAAILALTDTPLSPLVPLAGTVLFLREAEVAGVRSLSASMCLAVSLIVAAGTRIAARAAPA